MHDILLNLKIKSIQKIEGKNELLEEKNKENILIIGPESDKKVNLSLLPQMYKDIKNQKDILLITDDMDIAKKTVGMVHLQEKDYNYYDFNHKYYYIDIFSLETKRMHLVLNALFKDFYSRWVLKKEQQYPSFELLKHAIAFLKNTGDVSFEKIKDLLVDKDYYEQLVKEFYLPNEDLKNNIAMKYLKNYYLDENLIQRTIPAHLFIRKLLKNEVLTNAFVANGRKNLLNVKDKLIILDTNKNCNNYQDNKEYDLLMNIFIQTYLFRDKEKTCTVYIENLEKVAKLLYIEHLILQSNRYNCSLYLFTDSISKIEQINDSLYDAIKQEVFNVGIYSSIYNEDIPYIKEITNNQINIDELINKPLLEMTYISNEYIYVVQNKVISSDEMNKIKKAF